MGSHARPACLDGEPVRPQGSPAWPPLWEDVASSVQIAVQNGSWGRYDGPNHEALLERMQQDLDTEFITLCSSGTVAVELALRGVGVTPGDEVIVPGYDFPGNIRNVLALDATPVVVDVSRDTVTLDPKQLAAAFSAKTCAVLVSHLHGGLAEMERIREIASKKSVPMIEDACQTPGARIDQQPAGTLGDVGVYSFGGSKLITAGRGGAVITNNAEIAQRIRLHRIRGNSAYPLSELQAAAILPQWKRLDADTQSREKTVSELRAGLAMNSGVVPFAVRQGDISAYYKVGFWYDSEAFENLPRGQFCQAMRAEGIAMDPGFPAVPETLSHRRYRAASELPHAIAAGQHVVMLHHPILADSDTAAQEFLDALAKIRHHARELREALA